MISKTIIAVFGALIVLSHKPRKVKEYNPDRIIMSYKLTKIDAG